jgi:hypothetical protein
MDPRQDYTVEDIQEGYTNGTTMVPFSLLPNMAVQSAKYSRKRAITLDFLILFLYISRHPGFVLGPFTGLLPVHEARESETRCTREEVHRMLKIGSHLVELYPQILSQS